MATKGSVTVTTGGQTIVDAGQYAEVILQHDGSDVEVWLDLDGGTPVGSQGISLNKNVPRLQLGPGHKRMYFPAIKGITTSSSAAIRWATRNLI